MSFDLVCEELRHYLMTLERGPHNYGGLVYSGITQLVPPHNFGPIQVVKNLPQLIRYKGEDSFFHRTLVTKQ